MAKPIVFFSATPSTINEGESSVLQWTVINATAVRLDGVSKGLTGTKTVSPSSTTKYTLIAGNAEGTTTKNVTVTVVEPPPPPTPPPPTPPPTPPTPPPPTPPPTVWDWIIVFVLEGFERLLGWTQGSLLTILGDVKDLITNFFGDIADFFSDVIGSVVDIIKDNVGSIFDWLSTAFFDFVDWIVDVGGDIAGFVTDKITGALDFLTDKLSDFFDWVKDLPGSIADYIGGAIAGFVDWTADQLGGIWDGIQTFFTEAISGFVEAFFGGVNTGIEQAKGSPLHSDEPVRNPVLKGLQKVVREHRKKYGRDIITGEKKHGNV